MMEEKKWQKCQSHRKELFRASISLLVLEEQIKKIQLKYMDWFLPKEKILVKKQS